MSNLQFFFLVSKALHYKMITHLSQYVTAFSNFLSYFTFNTNVTNIIFILQIGKPKLFYQVLVQNESEYFN